MNNILGYNTDDNDVPVIIAVLAAVALIGYQFKDKLAAVWASADEQLDAVFE